MFYQEISIGYKRLYRTGFWIGDYHCGGRLVGKERRAGIHGRNAFYRSGIVIGVEKNRFELNRRNRAMEINAICDDIPNIHGIRYTAYELRRCDIPSKLRGSDAGSISVTFEH